MSRLVLKRFMNSVLAFSLIMSGMVIPTPTAHAESEQVEERMIFEEGFEGSKSAITVSEGWTSTVTAGYDSTGNYGKESPSAKFDGTGKYIESPAFELTSEGTLTFWMKAQQASNGTKLVVEGLVNGEYTVLKEFEAINYEVTNAEVTIPSNVTKIKLIGTKASGNISIDDIKLIEKNSGEVTPPTEPEEVPLTGLVLTGASKLLTGEEKQLSVEYLPGDTTQKDVEFSTSNESVFTVNEHGVLTGTGAGTAEAIVTSVVNPEISHRLEVSVFHTIASARQLAVGTEVEVSGIVTFNDRNQTLHIQDETAGISVYNGGSTTAFTGINPGDRIKVKGNINLFNGLIQVRMQSDADFTFIETVGLPAATELTINELKSSNYDSQLVSIKEAIIDISAKTLTQGEDVLTIYFVPSDINVQTGDKVNVVGTMGQYNGTVQLYGSSATFTKVDDGPTPEEPDESGEIKVLTEGFDGYLTAMPSGWTEVGASETRPNYNSTGSCGVKAPCVKLVVEGQQLVSPTFELTAAGTLSFHTKGNASNNVMTSGLKVEAFINNEWVNIWSSDIAIEKTTHTITLPKSTKQLRFVMMKQVGNIALDDIILTTSDEPQTYLDIIEARQAEANTTVEVRGFISYNDRNQTLHIQDNTAGIAVKNSASLDISELIKGTEVVVKGKTNAYQEIVLEEFEIISKDNKIVAKEVSIKELNEKVYDSQLVSIKEAMIDLSSTTSTKKLTQGDDVLDLYFMPAGHGLVTGDIVNVEGTMGRYKGNAQIYGSSATFTKVEAADEQAPVITHTPVLSGNVDQDLELEAVVTDNKQITSVALNYRVVGASEYTAVSMKEVEGTYVASIAKSKLDVAGLEYFIEATDGLNKTTTEVYNVIISNEDMTGPEIFSVMPTENSNLGTNNTPMIGASYQDRSGIKLDSIKLALNGTDVTSSAVISETEIRFQVVDALEKGTHTVTLEVTDSLGNSSTKEWMFKIASGEKNLYFGQLHSHTNLSDGQGTIDEAYSYARDNANLDFFAVTDHSNSFDNDSKASIADGSASSKWQQGQNAADKYNQDGEFTAIYAYEMTWSAGTGKYGHMNTFNTPGFETRTNSLMNLTNYYAALKTQTQSVSQFNHPGTTFGDFVDFGFYDAAIDEQITLIEVGNGEGPVRGSGYFPSYEYYTRALDKGWHVAPTNNQDNHKGRWGNSNTARTVIEAEDLSRESIYDALSERRVYSTEDENLRISYELNNATMGSILGQQETLNFNISVNDPDAADTISSIQLITDGGRVAKSFTNINEQSKQLSFNLEPDASSTYYYVKVVQGDRDIAVTAPIWVGEKENIGISKVEASANKVLVGEELDVETVIFNNESTAIENVKVDYFLNGATEPFATEVIASIAGANVGSSKATAILTKQGKNTIEVHVALTIGGAEREFISKIEVSAVNPEDVTRVMIDGSKANAYVLNGSYPGNMNFVTQIIQDNGGVVTINEKELTDDLLKGFDLLLITDPESKSPASVYSESELAAIKNFVDNGGHLIMSSKADYGDIDGIYGNAAQGNAVLEAVGATVRFNDDQVIDKTENGGQAYRLYFDDYNQDSIYTKGIDFDAISPEQNLEKFSFYSGNSILVNNPSTTEIIVNGHSTTESDDADGKGDNTPVAKGDVVALAVETLPNGSKVVAAGVTFFSDFEMDPSNEYSNPQIMVNLLHDLAPEKAKTITPIAELHVDANNDNMPDLAGQIKTVEGIVTAGNTNSANAFFDVIYLQDETGGITIHPISNLKLALGQRVQITGTVGAYEGDTQLAEVNEATDVKIIDSSINLVTPKLMSTADSMLESNEGWLVEVQGQVTRIDVEKGNIFVNDGTGEARVFINGYIGSGSTGTLDEWKDRIKVGDIISAVGLAAEDPEGHRIRVRNTDEIVVMDNPGEPNLSSDATLKDLSVNQGQLTPNFSSNIYAYTVKVGYSVENITLSGAATHELATVKGLGTFAVNVGDNLFEIKVTAEDGTVKTYMVKVVRDQQPTNPGTGSNNGSNTGSNSGSTTDSNTQKPNVATGLNVMGYIVAGSTLLVAGYFALKGIKKREQE